MLIIERVAALNRAPLFANVHDHALAEIAQILRETVVEAGEAIIREGAEEAWMFILVEGHARVDVGGVEVARIGPGAAVGELAVIDPAPRSATVTALETALLFRIDRAPFREVMEEQPEVVDALLTMLTQRLRSAGQPKAPVG
jgi:CRP-like cAMP-binding protein